MSFEILVMGRLMRQTGKMALKQRVKVNLNILLRTLPTLTNTPVSKRVVFETHFHAVFTANFIHQARMILSLMDEISAI